MLATHYRIGATCERIDRCVLKLLSVTQVGAEGPDAAAPVDP